MIVVVDRGLAVLTRTWCMFEAFSALYRKGPISISMTFPGAYRSICVYRMGGGHVSQYTVPQGPDGLLSRRRRRRIEMIDHFVFD